MAKLSRKELMEGRANCKALLDSIDRELAAYPEDDAISAAAAAKTTFAFKTPGELKDAILDARRRPLAPAIIR